MTSCAGQLRTVIEKSVENLTQPNHTTLKAQVEKNIEDYLRHLKEHGVVDHTSLKCGHFVQRTVARDRRSVPKHRRVHVLSLEYSDGIPPIPNTYRGSYRKAKRNFALLPSIDVVGNILFQPVRPVEYLSIGYIVKEFPCPQSTP